VTQSPTNLGIIPTSCSSNGTCTASSVEIADDWLKLFLLKNASTDLSTMTREQFDRLAQLSTQMYDSIIGTNDPDLSAFKSRGGKLVSYHGVVSGLRIIYALLYANLVGRRHHTHSGQPALLRRRHSLGPKCARLLPTLSFTGSGPLLWW
jgi:hypothetical protein